MKSKKYLYKKPKLVIHGNLKDLTRKISGPGDGPSLMPS
ncbi:MAG: lasso RiPP family leader peptide-containing protein [Methanobacteriaceae archaeon]|nr:lasso RiPP family leader peptide-containing protein [Methanobacteriaceae archaeon]